MDPYSEQQVLLRTGSFSGVRPLQKLGSSYLAASAFKQPFCGNEEGWGPLSPHRYDFTPCFIDVGVAAVSVFGLVLGPVAIWWLLSKKQQLEQGTAKNIHFWVKQVSRRRRPNSLQDLAANGRIRLQTLLAALIADVAVQLAIQIINLPRIWYGDFRVWTTILSILSMLVIFSIQWIEHSRLRHANGVVLFYWLLLIISLAIKLRSLISQQLYDSNLPYFITYCVGSGFAVVEFLVEWLWPRATAPSGYEAISEDGECPVEYATVFSKLTFSWMTPLMRYGYKVFLTENDLWGLAKSDKTKNTGESFEKAWSHELKNRPNSPSLWLALFRAYGGPYMFAALFKIGNDVAQYIQPQLLRFLIEFVASYEEGHVPQPIIKGASIALAMFACAVFQTSMIVSCCCCFPG